MDSRVPPAPYPPTTRPAAPDRAWSLDTLLVEDGSDAAESLAQILRAEGFQVRVAADGASALRAAEERAPDVALLDIGLPDVDGYQVARRLQSQSQAKRPLLVAITGYGSAEDQRRSSEAGFDLHLVKPVEPKRLLNLLARFRALLTPTLESAPAV